MPIYAYTCKSCEHTLDALQKIADEPLVDCPECGQPELKRLLSAPRFRLKGSGWYETDFKKDNQRNLAGDKEAVKKDAKPAADKPAGDKPKADKADAKPKPASKSESSSA
jgi:putative FmdB family regulatory protein